MTEERINAYEGLFLFPQTVAANLQTAVDRLREILTKADAERINNTTRTQFRQPRFFM